MNWQNPLALTGLVALILPVLIHLLSRRQAVVQRFPSLRFLDVSRLLPTRSPRVTDIPLLLVRIGVLACAVVALAGPLFQTARRTGDRNQSLARVIIVDTSASAMNSAINGEHVVDSVAARATRLASEANTSTIIRTNDPSAAMNGAIGWLDTQTARGELVVMSDFQIGAVDSAVIAAVPTQYGVKLVRSATGSTTVDSPAVNLPVRHLQSAATSVTFTADSMSTNAEWLASPLQSDSSIVLMAAPAQRPVLDATVQAAQQIAAPPLADSTRRVTIVFSGAANTTALVSSVQPFRTRWVGDFIARFANSELLRQAVTELEALKDTAVGPPFAVLARASNGAPVVFGAESNEGGRRNLLLFARVTPGTIASASLIAAVQQAIGQAWTPGEFETRTFGDDMLKRLERAPRNLTDARADASRGRALAKSDYSTGGASDARWFWLLALALLLVEWYMRRERNAVLDSQPPVATTGERNTAADRFDAAAMRRQA